MADIGNLMSRTEKRYDRADLQDVDSISISLASPEHIRMWSYGEVKSPETISYRTHKPEPDGLSSAKIFGPIKDCECLCKKYCKPKYRGIICEKCGVEVCESRVRRERLGHIELKCKIVHPLFARRANSPIATLLGMSFADVEKIMYLESYMVLDTGTTDLKMYQVLSESMYEQALDRFGENAFRVDSGGDALHEALARINMDDEIANVRRLLEETKSETKQRALVRKLRLLHDFSKSGNRPEWMILECIPVSPPDLRPLVQMDGGRFVSADGNELYRRVINRNDRLGRMYAAKAPYLIIRNEQRMLQEAIDALFDNSKKSVSLKSAQGRALKSISESLRGKHGRFRQNLLGKRVDYSGRAVIVAGPHLKIHECGIPEVMAKELFKPFIIGRLINMGLAGSIRVAKKMIDRDAPEIFDILKDVVKNHPVFLNRAPTLHKLNFQAFIPRIIDTKAIQLHPLVCTAFNADFDGDQMAIHVPLSIEAQMEAWTLMLSANNVKNPQNGKPVHIPTKDMVVGMYMMTSTSKDDARSGRFFAMYEEALIAYENDVIGISTTFKYRFKYDHETIHRDVETTLGRLMIYRSLPQDGKIDFEVFNTVITSKKIAELMALVESVYGQKILVSFADSVKDLGFEFSTLSGLSFGKDDMVVPPTKQKHIAETFEKIKIAERQYADGYITDRERYNQVTDRWAECAEHIGVDMMKELEKTKDSKTVNSCYVMSVSGARATFGVLHQLGGMRGLLATASGKVLDTPVTSNFKEGLSGSEYFLSVCGARKGLSDTALKTATAGYLTRRLVDVSQDIVITAEDCGSTEGLTYSVQMDGGKITKPLSTMIMGRVLCDPLLSNTGKLVLDRGVMITNEHVSKINESGALSAKVRSAIRCNLRDGICCGCYGADLSSGKMVNIGEVVGILAAQSIGEPGAQLTMRTFHVGGTTSRAVAKPIMNSNCEGTAKFVNMRCVTDRNNDEIVVSGNAFVVIEDEAKHELAKYHVAASSKLLVKEGAKIMNGDPIAERDPYNDYIISEYDGVIRTEDFVPGISYKEKLDEESGLSRKVIVDWVSANRSLTPKLVICNEETGAPLQNLRTDGIAQYILSVDTIVTLKSGDVVRKGDRIARATREGSGFVKDITGGLPRVEALLEARSPKNPAIIAEMDGVIRFIFDYRLKNQIVIEAQDGSNKNVKYAVSKGRRLRVQEGSVVKKGDILADGSADPHAILSVNGKDAVASFLVDEVQQIYLLQGVVIDDKHIEIIVRSMLSKVEITDRGDSAFVNMQQYDFRDVEDENEQLARQGKQPAKYTPVLQGITRASIQDKSFISAAAFQETMRVLVDSAIAHRKDSLTGMKENVIIGGLIPGGTGLSTKKFKVLAATEVASLANVQETEINSANSVSLGEVIKNVETIEDSENINSRE